MESIAEGKMKSKSIMMRQNKSRKETKFKRVERDCGRYSMDKALLS